MKELCKYKDILGVPDKGIHSYRLCNIAVVDVALSLVGAYFVAKYFKWSVLYTTIGVFGLGIVLHRLFCVRTTVDKLLFPNAK